MNYFKRALYSINRKKGKTIILLAIVFILGNLIAGSVSIQQASVSVEETTKEKLGSTSSIDIDWEKIYGNLGPNEEPEIEVKPLSIEQMNKIGNLSMVKYYDYNVRTSLRSDNIKRYEPDISKGMVDGGDAYFNMKGVQYAPILDFQEKKNKLVDGRVFSESDIKDGSHVAIISTKLAEENNLNIGDTFTLKNTIEKMDFEAMNGGGMSVTNVEQEIFATRDVALEVVGTFDIVEYEKKESKSSDSSQPSGMMDYIKLDALNEIYVPNPVAISENNFMTDAFNQQNPDLSEEERLSQEPYYEALYVLKDVDVIKQFNKEATTITGKGYKIKNSTDAYDSIAGPIKSISSISNIVLMVSIGASLIIISLIVILFLRDRKHEFGIYLSLGEKKRKVLSQVVLEVVLIAFVGITISMFTGNFLAKGVSQTMIENQIQTENDKQNQDGGFYYSGGDVSQTTMTKEEVAEAYEVNFSLEYILIFYVIGLGTIIVSTLAPMIYIIRLNPKKILL